MTEAASFPDPVRFQALQLALQFGLNPGESMEALLGRPKAFETYLRGEVKEP